MYVRVKVSGLSKLMKMDDYHTKAVCYCAFLCVGYVSDNHHSVAICWPLPNNQDLYRQIAGYRMGVGDHRVG